MFHDVLLILSIEDWWWLICVHWLKKHSNPILPWKQCPIPILANSEGNSSHDLQYLNINFEMTTVGLTPLTRSELCSSLRNNSDPTLMSDWESPFILTLQKNDLVKKRPLTYLGLTMVDGMMAPLLLAGVSLPLLVVVSLLHFILKSLLSHKSLIFCTECTEFQQAPSVQIYINKAKWLSDAFLLSLK